MPPPPSPPAHAPCPPNAVDLLPAPWFLRPCFLPGLERRSRRKTLVPGMTATPISPGAVYGRRRVYPKDNNRVHFKFFLTVSAFYIRLIFPKTHVISFHLILTTFPYITLLYISCQYYFPCRPYRPATHQPRRTKSALSALRCNLPLSQLRKKSPPPTPT